MDAILLNATTPDAFNSLSEEDLTAALSMINVQAGTNLTIKVLEAATTLLYLSTSSTSKSATSINESKTSTAATEKLQAAMALVFLSTSNSNKSTTSVDESNQSPASNKLQATETDTHHQRHRDYLAAYQRQRRAKQPKGYRKVEYRRFVAKETKSHRAERLRKRREREGAKRAKGKRAQ